MPSADRVLLFHNLVSQWQAPWHDRRLGRPVRHGLATNRRKDIRPLLYA